MQPDPVDSTTMVSDADHGWDEQYQYESDQHKDRLLRLVKIIAHLHKEVRLDNLDEPDQSCKQQLERRREQELLDSPQRKWETGEGLNRVIMERLEDMGKVVRLDNLPQGETERRNFRVQIKHTIKEAVERHMCMRSLDYFVQLLDNLRPSLLLRIVRNDLSSDMEVHKFSKGVGTNNVFPSIYVPNFLRKNYLSPKVENQLKAKHKPMLSLAYAKGNRVRKSIFVISSAGNGGFNSEETSSTLTGGNNHHRETIALYNDMPEVILDNQAHVHCTGNFNVLSNLNIGCENVVLIAANGGEMETFMSGSVHMGNFILPDVHYCPELGNRIIISGSILDNDDYGYQFARGKFTVKDLKNDTTVGEGRLVDNNYILEYLKISGDRTRVSQQPGLVTTAWNTICSALHRMGLNPQGQGAPM